MDPRDRKATIDAELLALRGNLQRAQARARGVTAAAARAWTLGVPLARVVVLIFWLSDGVVDPAITYLRQKGRQNHWPDKDDDELAALVDTTFLVVSGDEIVALSDTEAPLDEDAMTSATRYMLQWRIRSWTLAQNRKGIAPSTSDLLLQLEAGRCEQP
jgi:hypothetical protein